MFKRIGLAAGRARRFPAVFVFGKRKLQQEDTFPINEVHDMDREDIVLQEMEKRPGERVFSFLLGGRRIWVKRAEHVYHEAWLRFARRACLGPGTRYPAARR